MNLKKHAISGPLFAGQRPAIPAVEFSGVNFAYSNGERILENVNLSMPQASFMAVIGPNGGGKTTLLKLILGLLRPDSGRIMVFGKDPVQARGNIGYVPQFSTLNKNFPVSVLEAVLMGAAEKSVWRGVKWKTDAQARAEARSLLRQLGLEGCEKSRVGELSGGQTQRVMVARALMGKFIRTAAQEPYLLILDEPTSNIDPEGKCCFYDFLETAGKNVSVIVVSHDLVLAASSGQPLFDSIAIVNRTLTYSEDPSLNPDVLRAFFGSHQADCPITGIMDSMAGGRLERSAKRHL